MEQQLHIVQAVKNIFEGTDARDWERVRKAMAEKVWLDYSSVSGEEPSALTPKSVTDKWAGIFPGFDKTQHQLSDFQITENGNDAVIQFSGKADHFIGDKIWMAAGSYDAAATRTETGWAVTRLKFNLSQQSGDTSLPQQAAKKATEKMKKNIHFNSDGLTLAGDLYMPPDFNPSGSYPAIIIGGSWTTVKEQMSGLYAAELAKEGYITLAFDPRYFGESEGEPRFREHPDAKIADFRNALTYLQTVEGVDRENLFLLAICASAGYMATVVAQDGGATIKGFATVAAWLHDAETVKPLYGGAEGVQQKIKQGKEAKKKFAEAGEVEYIKTVSKEDKTAAMAGDFPYYQDTKRGLIPEWSADKFAVMSWEDWLTYDPMPVAKQIQTPTIMVHSDDAAIPDNVKKFFNDIPPDTKKLHWTKGAQFDFYDQPEQVGEAVREVTSFFKELQ